MIKKIFVFLLLLTCFWSIKVKADETTQIEDETKKVAGDSCIVTITFKEESDSGVAINSGNGVNTSTTNTIGSGGSGSKTSRALQRTTFTNGSRYTVDGWYDEDGNPVPESMYYNATTPTRIRVSYACSKEEPEDLNVTYILKWIEEKAPIYNFNVHDAISTGSHHWDNTDGHFGSYTYTFKEPDAKTHYQFLYYKLGDNIYNVNDKYSHDITGQGYGTDVTEDAYAYWQADVTLNLYSDGKLISEQSGFESVSINTTPEKYGYNFLGWEDENGKEVSETTFYPEEFGIKPNPVIINLYAKWEQIKRDIEVTKIWDDENNLEGLRPENITIEILADGTKVGEKTFTGEGNEWKYTFKDLVKYGTDKEIVYEIKELEVENYKTKIEGFTVTNSRKVEKVDLTIKKNWDDVDNQDGLRPDNLSVSLSNGTEVTLNSENNWSASVNDLQVYENGEKISYTWKEANVNDYELTDTKVDGNITTITNTHKPELTKVNVTKVWSDDNNESGKRPIDVTIILLADNEPIDKVVLSNDNEWKYTFDLLPVFNNGVKIKYTVNEEKVADGYVVSYEESEDGFIIHNVLGQGDGKPDEVVKPEGNNPQTGDNIYLYLITLLISLVGFIGGKKFIKANN